MIAALSALLLTGCLSLPAPRVADCGQAGVPAIAVSADGLTASTTFTVLSYNIEGLGWPARGGRRPSLRAISRRLANLRDAGEAPDVIMVQEMFSRAAIRSMVDTGYANRVTGPARTQRKTMPPADPMPGPYRWTKGEMGFHVLNSGLAIFSRFPITHSRSEPYGAHRCAGFDCLSNKGVLFARMAIPGVPVAIDLFNTHLNSQKTSGVAPARHTLSHDLQSRELAAFLDRNAHPDAPMILGGDFNMKDSPERFAQFGVVSDRMMLVHEWCARQRLLCDVRLSWDGDEPWMDTHDLQLFRGTRDAILTPIRVEAMFDGSPGDPQLSDHDGFLVTYRLSWNNPVSARPNPVAAQCATMIAALTRND